MNTDQQRIDVFTGASGAARESQHIDHDDDGVGNENKDDPQSGDWPDPKDIAPKLLPVPSCDSKMLPEGFRTWLEDISERFQCPIDFPAVAAIVAASSVVGRQLAIRPKSRDDWEVISNLWGAVVGNPSVMKSPALVEGMAPLNDLRRRAQDEHRSAMEEFEFNKLVTKTRREQVHKALQSGAKGGRDLEQGKLEQLRKQFQDAEEPEPVERRYLTSDTTVEKLGELLNQNLRGMMLFRDELIGFLKGLERGGHEQDRSFFIEAWGGYGRFDFDRIGRGTLHIEATCVSILGGIQPDPLRSYLQQTFVDGRNDGFIQRFQMLVYPDIAPEWKNVDRSPDVAARARVRQIFESLDSLPIEALGAVTSGPVPYVRFTDEAQDFFNQWRSDLETRIREGEEAPVMVAHLAKYRSLMPSLALLFFLVERSSAGFEGSVAEHFVDGRVVSLHAAELAAGWCDFLEAHARRVFQTVTLRHRAIAAALAKKIKDGKLPNPFTARLVYSHDWAELSNPEDVIHALEVLEDADWVSLSEIKNPTGGRPKVEAFINPKVMK